MRASFHEDYEIPLPEGHPFPMRKFSALRDILLAENVLAPGDLMTPDEIAWEDLELVHTPSYLHALRDGTMDAVAVRRLGLPWSPALVRRSRLAVHGTTLAGWQALEDGVAANLAGGTHHACPDHGEGFCVLNDVGVAIRILQREEEIRRTLIVDLDVHQGNGNAILFADDPSVFTFSMHCERGSPGEHLPSNGPFAGYAQATSASATVWASAPLLRCNSASPATAARIFCLLTCACCSSLSDTCLSNCPPLQIEDDAKM